MSLTVTHFEPQPLATALKSFTISPYLRRAEVTADNAARTPLFSYFCYPEEHVFVFPKRTMNIRTTTDFLAHASNLHVDFMLAPVHEKKKFKLDHYFHVMAGTDIGRFEELPEKTTISLDTDLRKLAKTLKTHPDLIDFVQLTSQNFAFSYHDGEYVLSSPHTLPDILATCIMEIVGSRHYELKDFARLTSRLMQPPLGSPR